MAAYPTCETPSEITLTLASDGFTIVWSGSATVYKMAYKKERDSVWTSQTGPGPGSSGGSGINDDTSAGSGGPAAKSSSASFSVGGLAPDVYDLRAINVCSDGSVYTREMKFILMENVGTIPNLRLQEDPGGNYQINIQWERPTIDSGNPIRINWCKINQFGQKLDCTLDEVDHTVTKYSIINPGPDLTEIWVSQLAANGFQYSVSEPLLFEGIPCEENGCEYKPYTLEEVR